MPAQDSIDVLINYFNQLIALSKVEKELVREKFHHRLYRKRHRNPTACSQKQRLEYGDLQPKRMAGSQAH